MEARRPATTSLTPRGYGVVKAELAPGEADRLRRELTVTPVSVGGPAAGPSRSFRLFLESERRLHLPRYFGLQRYGVPAHDAVGEGQDLSPGVSFAGELRAEQRAPVD